MRFRDKGFWTAAAILLLAPLPAQAATKLNFMYTAVTQFVGLYVAKDQGMLAKHGIDIDMTLTSNGSLISAALVADTAQLGFPQMADALKSHLVDAVASVDPFYTRVIADKTGYDIGSYSSVIPAGTSPVNFVATRTWAEKNVETIKALQAALDEAAVYIKDPANDKSVRASVATYTKLPAPVAAVIDVPKVFAVHIMPDALAFWIQVSREQGLIKGNPDPKSLIYP